MYCSNCGKQIPDISRFCPSCGNKVEAAVAASTTSSTISSTNSRGTTNLELPYKMKMISNVTNPLRQISGSLTITANSVEFKHMPPFLGGDFVIPVSQIAVATRVTYAVINPCAMEIRLKDGKKYTVLLNAWDKSKAQKVVDLVNSLL